MVRRPLRGVNHVGITVPDIETATTFLIEGLGATVIYESYSSNQPPKGAPELEHNLNLAPGTKLVATRMINVGTGPDIELFQLLSDDQPPAVRPSDFGLQYLAFYADDIDEAARRFEAAGGDALAPQPDPVSQGARGRQSVLLWANTVGNDDRVHHLRLADGISERNATAPLARHRLVMAERLTERTG